MSTYDVCIMGAGLAGLTLARQLHMRRPELAIALIEHRRFPMREAAHKVGESTVEIAAHYLSRVLDLEDHLVKDHLPKFGLRLFFRGDQPIRDDLARYDELGGSRILPVPTYQVDRGRLENHLAEVVRTAGVTLIDGATVRTVNLNKGNHQLTVQDGEAEMNLSCRYVVDATGRRGWLRQQCALQRTIRHTNHAVWLRVQGSLDVDAWSQNIAWKARCLGTPRRLSTNHFTGPGYWLWLIPLASGATSVGLVFDPRYVDLDKVNQYPRLLDWIAAEHPLVGDVLEGRQLMDFHVLRDYAAGARQIWSEEGWSITGDAGLFSDPFYSPGTDFIAFANGYLTELICADGDASRYVEYQRYFFAFFSNTLSLYRGQYGGFGNRDLMVIKTCWDFLYYWGVLSKLFFSSRYTDRGFMNQVQKSLVGAATLNSGMQKRFRQFADSGRVGGDGEFYDYHAVPLFHDVKKNLLQGDPQDAAAELQRSLGILAGVSKELITLLARIQDGRRLPDLADLGARPAFAFK